MTHRSFGRLAVGGILVVVGVLWLLQSLDILDVPLRAVLPVALIGIGVALVAGSRRGSYPVLVIVGAVLVAILAIGSAVDSGSRVGDRVIRPVSTGAVFTGSYDHGAGRVELDLTSVAAQSATVQMDVGVGRLEVVVPNDVSVRAVVSVGIGSYDVLGEEGGGLGVDRTVSVPGSGGRTLVLTIDVGIGSVEVRRGDPRAGIEPDVQRQLQRRLERQQRELQERLADQQEEFRRRQEQLQRELRERETTGA